MAFLARASVLLFLLVAAPLASSQETIPITMAGGAILVPVVIGERKLNFLLDTGSTSSSIDPATAAELKLTSHGTKRIQKNFRDLVVDVTEVGPITILNVEFARLEFAEINLAPLAQALGTPINGVLGLDVLKATDFKLSYSKQTLVVGPLSKLGKVGTALPLQQYKGQFLVTANMVSVPTKLVLDTGTNSTNLSSETWDLVTAKWSPRQVVEGVRRAGNPTSPAILICLPSIRLGDIMLSNQVVRVQTRSDAGAFSSEDFGGILGSDILRQFELTFDLKNDSVYITPDERYEINRYRYTTVGIQIAKNDKGAVEVMSVWKNSPAETAGIEEGDLITAINGQSVASQTLEQASRMLHAKEGTEVKLEVERHAGSSTIKTIKTQTLLCGP
jgi:predicted aspartyl protease